MKFNRHKLKSFKQTVKEYYRKHKRNLPWRETQNPYYILVSEIMLQQTQVPRVLQKYPSFIRRFPDFLSLAGASNADVLREWQGMGYNRRALYLKQIAEIVMHTYNGFLPRNEKELDLLPGIGEATAASIAAFVYNIPTVFIETNIRRVFIHHFFKDRHDIDDREIFPLVKETLDIKNPREWYYALMDYGSNLGKIVANPNRKSKHYTVQARFEGSDRQLRGKIIKVLLQQAQTRQQIISHFQTEEDRIKKILDGMVKEGFIQLHNNLYVII